MKTGTTLILAVTAIVLVGLAVAIKASVWNECRADHSWFYCMHVIG